jgi:predicted nucleotidyltransferase
VHEHHHQTIENLKSCYEKDPDCLGLVVIGSVARGETRPESDVDFYLIVSQRAYDDCMAKQDDCVDAHEYSVSPCTEANGYLISLPALKAMADAGREIERWMFTKALVVFSKDAEIDRLVAEIPRYPEANRVRHMESYHSQMYYHISFFEFAYLSQTRYLIYETATKLILSIGRLILADNRILYPNRKWFFRELLKAPDKPEGICEAMEAYLDAPTIEAGHQLIDMVEHYKSYPLPPEGMKARISQESILNLEEW